jgi:hypothetical protein
MAGFVSAYSAPPHARSFSWERAVSVEGHLALSLSRSYCAREPWQFEARHCEYGRRLVAMCRVLSSRASGWPQVQCPVNMIRIACNQREIGSRGLVGETASAVYG